MAPTEFVRNEDGNVTNPPVLAEFEQRLSQASLAADQDAINRIQDEYNQAREDEIKRIESQQQQEQNDPQGSGW